MGKTSKKAMESEKTTEAKNVTESSNNDKPSDENSQETRLEKRYDRVDPKRVFAQLEVHGLPTDGTPNERADRLAGFYVHEAQKKKIKLADCQPDDAADELCCGFLSDEKLAECPFCGKGGEVVTLPKAAPKADKDIELNVKAAETKVEEKQSEKLAKVNSKKLKEKKKERGEVVKETPAPAPSDSEPSEGSTEIVSAKSEVVAIDLPSESAGGSAADLDRICLRIDATVEGMLKNEALSMWEIGRDLAEIRDKKLWSTIRNNADGSYLYSGMNVFIAQRFYFTPDHAAEMMRIATTFSKQDAEIGAAKARTILAAKLPDDMTLALVAFAKEKDERNKFVHTLNELKMKIRIMKDPQLPAASTSTRPTPSAPSNASDGQNDEDRDDEDDEDDEDRDDEDDEPESSRPATKPAARPAQMLSVSFEKREFSIPLVQKGSQIKAAKKIQDEPHGTLQVPGGTKIHFVVKIGDDGQVFIEARIETPY